MEIGNLVYLYFLLINAISFGLMIADKKLAKKRRKKRIRERTLLLFALFGGALGTWIAMQIVRHKTQHASFRVLAPLFTFGWAVVLLWFLNQGWLG